MTGLYIWNGILTIGMVCIIIRCENLQRELNDQTNQLLEVIHTIIKTVQKLIDK